MAACVAVLENRSVETLDSIPMHTNRSVRRDEVAIRGEQSRERAGVSAVPCRREGVLQRANVLLVARSSCTGCVTPAARTMKEITETNPIVFHRWSSKPGISICIPGEQRVCLRYLLRRSRRGRKWPKLRNSFAAANPGTAVPSAANQIVGRDSPKSSKHHASQTPSPAMQRPSRFRRGPHESR